MPALVKAARRGVHLPELLYASLKPCAGAFISPRMRGG